MSHKNSIVITEDGEVLDQVAIVPMGDGSSLKELIPYNRMTHIARQALSRVSWDKKKGVWLCSLGEFSELTLVPKASTELFAVWTDQIGKPDYYGVDRGEAEAYGDYEMGYRVAFIEETIGPCYSDFFGLTRDFAEAVCKIATYGKDEPIKVKGNSAISTSNGTFYVPKIVR